MLNKIADFYEEEVDVAVAALTSLIEPIMMVGIGGMVGVVLVAMYLPIFDLAGKIKGRLSVSARSRSVRGLTLVQRSPAGSAWLVPRSA